MGSIIRSTFHGDVHRGIISGRARLDSAADRMHVPSCSREVWMEAWNTERAR